MGQTGLEKFSGVIVVFLLCPDVVQVLLKFWGQLCVVVTIVLLRFFFINMNAIIKGIPQVEFHKHFSTSDILLYTPYRRENMIGLF